MSDLFWLSEPQVERLGPFFPKPRGKPRVDGRRGPGAIIQIQRNGSMWTHARGDDGPSKTLRNRRERWSRIGPFATVTTERATRAQDTEIAMIDATHLKTHRTASGPAVKKGRADG